MRRTREGKKSRPGRLNIIVDTELKNWVFEYAGRNHTTVTSLITSYFVLLKRKESNIDVEQL